MSTPQITLSIILAIIFIMFCTQSLRIDLTGVIGILSLITFGILTPKEAFSGFSSEPALLVAFVFVVAAGLTQTGALETLTRFIEKQSGTSELKLNILIMSGVALFSAFTHHLMVTALVLPVAMRVCEKNNIPASRVLIPMATAASLGTTLTLIGAPAFLVMNDISKRSGGGEFGLFSVAPIGAALILSSFVLILLLKWLLPKKTGSNFDESVFQISDVHTELVVLEKSKWAGSTLEDVRLATEKELQILELIKRVSASPENENLLEKGDILRVRMPSRSLRSIKNEHGLQLKAINKYVDYIGTGLAVDQEDDTGIAQAVVANRAVYIGRSVAQNNFLKRFGLIVIGLWRKDGWIGAEISHEKIREGDLLIFWGLNDRMKELYSDKNFLTVSLLNTPLFHRHKKRLAIAILLGAIGLAVGKVCEPLVAFAIAAVGMVLTGCITANQAVRSIESKVFILIASVIPFGIAMDKTKLSTFLADRLSLLISDYSEIAILLMFFGVAALLTQILSDAATTILVGPIAFLSAQQLNISPKAALVCVTMGAVASFLTPIGHHGNLLVLSPGRYKFSDFLKMGIPLTLMIAVETAYISQYIFPNEKKVTTSQKDTSVNSYAPPISTVSFSTVPKGQ